MTHPDDLAADIAQFQRVLDGEVDGYAIDKRWIRKDGTVIHSIMAARCGRRPDGSVDYVVGLVQDITERKLASEALAEAQAQLARMMRVTTMGELAASIAHEVNQPLAAIVAHGKAAARWLAASPPDPAEVNTALERIVRDASRAADILNGIRAFLRRQPSQRASVNVSEAVADVLGMLQGELRSSGVSVTYRQSALELPVHADRVQLQQVILNLLRNAIDAMRSVADRARVVTIEVARHGADMLCIAVRDCGVGIDPSQLERIFDPFHTSKPDGMGMGLAISRSIVQSHGGRLWVTPNAGPGVTFQFVLPLSPKAVS
jgi:C4-dicarboxylate-specific signal transduction histidine kinase